MFSLIYIWCGFDTTFEIITFVSDAIWHMSGHSGRMPFSRCCQEGKLACRCPAAGQCVGLDVKLSAKSLFCTALTYKHARSLNKDRLQLVSIVNKLSAFNRAMVCCKSPAQSPADVTIFAKWRHT